ncbi:hypothetical protein JCM10295v2_001988 [Rhodotorula toruloides]
MSASRTPLAAGDTSPAPSSPSSPPSLPAEQCLTPPSVRRREARLARCAIAASHGRGGGAEAEAAGDSGSLERPRTGYAADQVEARRVGRRQAEREGWRGWEVEAERYEGQRWGEGFVRADGTVDWARLDAATVEEVGPAPNALLVAPETLFLRDSLDAEPAMLPSAPSMTARLGLGSLPSNTLPLVLSVLYIVFRAFGLGLPSHRRTRSAGQNGAGEKVRMAAFERNSRE